MTGHEESMTTLQILQEGEIVATPSENIRRPISGEVQRFATHIRTNAKGRPHVLMITPASPRQSVLRLAYEAALGLVQINESPVLVMDLQPQQPGASQPVPGLKTAANPAEAGNSDEDTLRPATADIPTLTVIRPLDGEDAASYVSSPRFARIMEDAKKSFAHILIATDCVLQSASGLVAASLCDNVVLVVKEDTPTTTNLLEVKRALLRNRAKLLGFIYEKR
jgi:hypothetical protein